MKKTNNKKNSSTAEATAAVNTNGLKNNYTFTARSYDAATTSPNESDGNNSRTSEEDC